MKYFNKTFPIRLIKFLSQKTGHKKGKANAYAFFLINLFEKLACINGRQEIMRAHFNDYIKLQKHNQYNEMGTRIRHRDMPEMIYYTIEDRGTIADMIKELTQMGYISRTRTGQNVNSSGISKRDASFKYKINLKKLVRDMDNTKIIENGSEKLCLYKNDNIQYYGVKIKLQETFGNQLEKKK